jgi:hypothetical protein
VRSNLKKTVSLKRKVTWLINKDYDYDYYYNTNGNNAYILHNLCTTYILKGKRQELYNLLKFLTFGKTIFKANVLTFNWSQKFVPINIGQCVSPQLKYKISFE